MRRRMHVDQVDVQLAEVRALLAAQFPQWRDEPVVTVPSYGTSNALFRVGEDVVLRFPLQPDTGAGGRDRMVAEQHTVRLLAPQVSSDVPEPLGVGAPGPGYAGWWAAYRWVTGDAVGTGRVDETFARDVAGFVTELRAVATAGTPWDVDARGGLLARQDAAVRAYVAAAEGMLDTRRLLAAWAQCRDVPPPPAPVWVHGDLMPGNLLVRDGRLAAVLDWELARVADPALDLMPAWNLFDADARRTFRAELEVGDDEWERGRGWAIVQAVGCAAYYVETNPVMSELALRTIAATLE